MAEEKKTGPNDGDSYYQEGDKDEDEGEKKKRKSKEKDDLFQKELKEAEIVREEKKEREKEKLRQFQEKDKGRKKIREEEEVEIGGQKVKPKKIYSHKKGKGIFIRNKTNLRKVKKGLKKIHGLSAKEKKLFPEIVAAYNPTKIEIRKDKLKKLFLELKHVKSGRRGGADFQRLRKTFDKDFLKKQFGSKRMVIKIERELFGKKDPLKHKMKRVSNRTPNKAGKAGSTSPSARVGKRF